jgi:hypothetical protein
MKMRKIAGRQSWVLTSDCVEAAVTESGGHLGPVTFSIGGKKIQPFHIAPWAEEKSSQNLPPILRSLRGDFFCMPFGGNAAPWRGEQHPLHGETANVDWKFAGLKTVAGVTDLKLSCQTTVRSTQVEKLIRLKEGESAVYSRHTVAGGSGPMNFGHHAMLKFPSKSGSGKISTSPIAFGQVYPGQFEDPVQGGYSSLLAGAEFDSLDRVPLAVGGYADLTRYPVREGFEDLVIVSSRLNTDLAWTAVTFQNEGYVWFALKDPRVLASTVLWCSNGGRHYPPWNGRHRYVFGLEEVTSYFHEGLAESARKNSLSARGIPTVAQLNPKQPLVVNLIMAVATIPKRFGPVTQILPESECAIVHGAGKKRIRVALDSRFLYRSN